MFFFSLIVVARQASKPAKKDAAARKELIGTRGTVRAVHELLFREALNIRPQATTKIMETTPGDNAIF